MEPIRVLLVDDHVLLRQGLAGLMRAYPDLEVVGEAGDGRDGLARARELMPDVVLMDINMPVCDGIEATRLIKQELPHVRVIMLTVSDEDDHLFEALKAGAQGYLLKNIRPEDLHTLLMGVPKGEAPLSPAIASKMLAEFARGGWQEPPPVSPGLVPTPREKQILQLIAEGASNKEIARRLYITEGTVKNHLHNILDKLHLRNRAEAAAYAVREGLISPLRG